MYSAFKRIALVAAIALAVPGALADQAVLNASADNRLLQFSPDTSGPIDFLSVYDAVGNDQRTVIHFDLAPIPVDSMIDSATLRLNGLSYFGATTNTSFSAYRIIRAWNETQVTWNRAETGTNWTTPGGDFVGSSGQSYADAYGTWSGAQSPNYTWYEVDVTGLIREYYDGTHPNYGIGLDAPVGCQLTFVSSEGAAPQGGGGGQVPELVVNYSPIPEPASGLLVVLGVALLRRR
ncbi:MAG: DNRLRE domain-containing protein [Phycisphaerales bacterium]|nr:DNRLRE domain-containing protein [Phycisphaerales bacterium]